MLRMLQETLRSAAAARGNLAELENREEIL